MSYPILYKANEKTFDHNGIGILSSCISCIATEETSGLFELSLTYPIDGIHVEEIVTGSIIKAKANDEKKPQLFRVYSIGKPMFKNILISARHISYDLSGFPVSPFGLSLKDPEGLSAQDLFDAFTENSVLHLNFSFRSDVSRKIQNKYFLRTPTTVRSLLSGSENSVQDIFGGVYDFDNFEISLKEKRGNDNGFSVKYGKNLIDLKQEQNISSVSTGIYPYWVGKVDDSSVYIELPEKVIHAKGLYDFLKIVPLDTSSVFPSQPSEVQLREYSQNYIIINNIGVPKVSLTASFYQLFDHKTKNVSLYDTGNVEFPAMKVHAKAVVSRLVYNSIAEKVESVSLGEPIPNIADTISKQWEEIRKQKMQINDLKRGV